MVFFRYRYGVPSFSSPGGDDTELIIFVIGTYSFYIISIIKTIFDFNINRR